MTECQISQLQITRWIHAFERREKLFNRDAIQQLFPVKNKARLFDLARAGFNRHSMKSGGGRRGYHVHYPRISP